MRESLSHCSNLNLQCVCYFTVNLLHWKWGIIPFWEWLKHFNLPVTIFSNLNNAIRCAIWNHLYSFKKVKNTHGSVTFSKVAGSATLLKATLLSGCFSRYLSCANGTKLRKTSHIWFQSFSTELKPHLPLSAKYEKLKSCIPLSKGMLKVQSFPPNKRRNCASKKIQWGLQLFT